MKQKIQIFLILGIIVAAIRVAWIFYERHEDSTISQKQQAAIDPDFYVHPQKIFPYNPRSRRVDFEHEAGKLLPLQRLNVSDLVAGTSQKDTSQKQLLAVFDDGGKQYATAVGTEKDGFYS